MTTQPHKRHIRIAGHMIDYGRSRTTGTMMYFVGVTGNAYACLGDAIHYASAHPRKH